MKWNWHWPVWRRIGIFALAYLAVGVVTGYLANYSAGAIQTPIRFTTGLYVAALLLAHPRTWPALALSALAASFATHSLFADQPAAAALAHWLCDTVEAFLGAWLVVRFVGTRLHLDRLRQTLGLFTFSAVLSTLPGAMFRTALVGALNLSDSFWHVWHAHWLQDALGVLVTAPAVLTGAQLSRRRFAQSSWWCRLEFLALFGGLGAGLEMVFRDGRDFPLSMAYLGLPFSLWAALRFGPPGAALATALVAVNAVAHTVVGEGPCALDGTREGFIELQAFLSVVGLSTLVLATVTAERKWVERSLDVAADVYESLVNNIPQAILRKDLEGRFTFVNETFRASLGRTLDQIIGRTDDDFYPRALADKYRADDGAVIESGRVLRTDEWHQTGDGRRIHVHTVKSPIRDAAGRILGIQVIFDDVTDRKLHELTLRASEERFRALVESTPGGIWQTTSEGETIYINPAMCAYLEIAGPQEMIGRTYRDFFTPESIAKVQEEHAKRRRGETSTYEVEVVGRRGTRRFLSISGAPLFGSDGNVQSFIATLTDITARRAMEQSLRDREAQLRVLLEQMPAVLWVVDRDLRFTVSLGKALDGLGLQPNQVVGSTLFEFFHTDDPKFPPIAVHLEALQGRDSSFVSRWVGNVYQSYVAPLRDGDGEITGVIGTAFDLTEREAAEQRVRRYQALLEAIRAAQTVFIAESSPAAAFDTLLDGLLTITESEFGCIGSVAQENGARSLKLQVRAHPKMPRHAATLAPVDCEIALEGSDPPTLFHQVLEGDGLTMIDPPHAGTIVTGLPVDHPAIETFLGIPFHSGGQVAGLIGLANRLGGYHQEAVDLLAPALATCAQLVQAFRNEQQRQATERALQESEERFLQAQKLEAIGRLAGGIAHDFNNLLTVITGYAVMMLQRLDPSSPHRWMLEQVHKAGERAACLTQQLLAFSRKQLLKPAVVNLNGVIAGMAEMLRRLIGEDIHLSLDLDDDLWEVRVDAAQLEQSIVNLVVNARDAMPQGGEIFLAATNVDWDDQDNDVCLEVQPGPYVVLAVRDTGCGMDEATKANVFEPFFTTKDVGKGTGLGLAMVYGFVKQSGGHVAVDSEPGCGSTFRILLPRRRVEGLDEPLPVALGELSGTETVLLVEDDDSVRGLARQILEMQGYRVLEAGGGPEALQLSDRFGAPIHLLVTDVVMPFMNGRELAEQLRQRRTGLKTLYLSGYTDDAIVRHGIATDGVPFLYKPFTPGTLAQKVRHVLDQP